MVEINNLTGFKFDKKILENLVKKILDSEKKTGIELSVTFVGQKEIQKLNKKYRKKDRPTDVLSFTYKNSLGLGPVTGEAGEVIVCPKIIKENAKKYGEIFQKELTRVLIHGILHILGYNHERGGKEAQKMAKKTRTLFNLTTNY